MTKVVDIRDRLNAIMQDVHPTYKKLADSYETADNANPIWEKGYSIGYSPGENITTEWCNLGAMRKLRQFQTIMTNIYLPNMDADYREALENGLMNDHSAFISAVEKDPTLTGMDVSSRYSLDNGIEYLIDKESSKQFIVIVSVLTVDFFEET